MPANHVALLGQQKKVLEGYSQSSTLPHTGFIYYSDLVQKLPAVSDTNFNFIQIIFLLLHVVTIITMMIINIATISQQ